MIIDDVKTLLGIEGEDDKLNIMIDNAIARVLSLLNHDVTEVPSELEYIVTELTVTRYNRLGNEGMSSFGQDGESISYGDDIAPYLSAIEAWNAEHGQKGVLRFI